ncbi:MAG: CpaF family protein [Nitriliruptoraceae bacterium]|nr:CpaF family protein [Nitriliruptoraceae bacterium]
MSRPPTAGLPAAPRITRPAAPAGDPGPGAPSIAALRDGVSRRLRDDAELLAGRADRTVLRRAVARALAAEGVVAAPQIWARLVRDLVDDLGGLGPLEALLRDPAVTEVMANGPSEVHVERDGRLERVPVRFEDDAHLVRTVARALGPVGVRLDRGHPFADAVLEGGVRLHAILPPLASTPTVTLRRVPAVVPSWSDLAASGAVPEALAEQLAEAVRARRNVVVCGRAGVGKTTLLARLLHEVGDDRVVIIEDAPELQRPAPHSVHLRTRPATPDGVGRIEVADLLRNALRMRPDRLVIGELRGSEVADLLQAMNTGHDGSMTTVHANGAQEALVRLEGMALLAGLPADAVRAQLGTAVHLIVALGRDEHGRRRVDEVVAVEPSLRGPHTTRWWSR